jgi:ABC-type nickel/cobalt efflux system permease component RcnA
LVSILTAAALGAGHALTPGHGKTLMAAYLVGSRGTPVHAGWACRWRCRTPSGSWHWPPWSSALRVSCHPTWSRTAPIVAAISIVAIGGWMLLREARRRLSMGAAPASAMPEHTRTATPMTTTTVAVAVSTATAAVTPTCRPPARPSSWRSLFVLGLAGGLIPSASALLILLGSIAAGRPAFGFILVVAFGLGMALVMGGVGLALVIARGRL